MAEKMPKQVSGRMSYSKHTLLLLQEKAGVSPLIPGRAVFVGLLFPWAHSLFTMQNSGGLLEESGSCFVIGDKSPENMAYPFRQDLERSPEGPHE